MTGTVASDSFLNTTIGFDANAVAVPGTYKANVNVNSLDPKNPARTANMTLNVTAPASWGVLTGTVNSLGYCDANPVPASGAKVVLEAANGLTRTVTAGADGNYTLWLNSLTNPYTLTATAAEHVGSSPIGGITVDQLGAVSAAPTVSLRSIEPCVDYTPASLSVTVPWQGSASQTLTLTNSGAASSLYTVTEESGGFVALRPVGGSAPSATGFSEGFEGATFPPAGWTRYEVDASTTYQWTRLTTGAHTGTGLASHSYGGSTLIEDGMLILPDLPLADTPQLSFWEKAADPDFYDPAGGHTIWACTASCDAPPTNYTQVAEIGQLPDFSWRYSTVDLSAFANQTVRLAFRYYGDWADGWSLDDVSVTGLAIDYLPWLTESPAKGTVAADTGSQAVTVNFDATVADIAQPGTYYGTLRVATADAGLPSFGVPVTMTVVPTDTQGKLEGVVTSLGYCDVNPVPVNGASLIVQNSLGVTHTLTTNASGAYQEWFDRPARILRLPRPTTRRAQSAVASGLVTGTMTTTLNLNLRLNQPCIGTSPAAGLSANLAMGVSTTLPMSITNSGAYTLSFALKEADLGFTPLGPQAVDVLVVNDDGFNTTATRAFTTALTNLGYTYYVTASSSTTGVPVNLLDYKDIIWAGAPSAQKTTLVMAYLDAGGRFLVSDNDFGYFHGWNPVDPQPLWNVLRRGYGDDYGSDGVINGQDIMAGISTDVSSDPFPDSVLISGTHAVGIFANTSPKTDWAGLRIQRNAYKAILFTWDFNYTGGTSITATAKTDVLQRAMNWLKPTDLLWLSADVTNGAVTAAGSQALNVTFDASAADVTQPGTYKGAFAVVSNDPVNGGKTYPVTMTVSAPATWGKLTGIVNGLSACDVNPTPMANAVVYVESGSGMTWTLKTDVNGAYKVWMPAASSPLTITASNEAGFEAQTTSGVSVSAGITTTQGFSLRAYLPCAGTYVPSPLTTIQNVNQLVTKTLTISNTGAGLMNWNFQERTAALQLGAQTLESEAKLTSNNGRSLKSNEAAGRNQAIYSANPNAVVLSEGFEGGVVPPTGWTKVSTSSFTWKRNTTGPHTGANAADVEYDSTLAQQDEWLLSPQLQLSSATLSFWSFGSLTWCKTTNDNCDLEVWLVVGAPGGGDDVYVGMGDDAWTSSYVWAQSAFNLTPLLPSQPFRIGFRYYGLDGAQVALDDISVDGASGVVCGSNALPWVSAVPVSGTTAAAGTSPVEVVFNSAGMAPGSYSGFLCLNTNDPSNPKIEIPVATTISGELTLVYHDLEDVIHAGDELYAAGGFNSWNATATQMTGNADNSVFTVTVPTNQSSLELKYVVYTDTAHSGPANWNWLQTNNRVVVMTGTMTADHFRNIEPGYYVLQWPYATSTVVGVPTENIYAQVWADDLTARSGAPRGLMAELGYGTAADASLWTWQALTWGSQSGNNDEFAGAITPSATGVYSYAVRFNANWGAGNPNAHWSYGDKNWGTPFSTSEAGVLTVGERRGVSLTPATTMLLGKKGTVVTHTVQIANTGSTTDTFDLTATGNTWAVSLSASSFTLGAGQSATLYVYATVPPEVETSDTVTVKAASAADVAKQATAALTTAVKYFNIFTPLVRR